MAERIVSPGVFTREKDLSFLPQGITDIGAALIGPTETGPAFVPTIVRNLGEFEQIFGKENQDFYVPFTAKQYLRSAGTVTIVRVLGLGGYSAQFVAIGLAGTGSNSYGGSLTGNRIAAVLRPSKGNSGEAPNSSTLPLNGEGSASLADHSNWASGSLTLTNGSQGSDTFTISFNTSSANYIGKVFSSNPQDTNNKVYLAVNNKSIQSSLSWTGANTQMTIASGSDAFAANYSVATTPTIKSQTIGGSKIDLFQVNTISHGSNMNAKYKIGISDVKAAVDVPGSDYGSFTLTVQVNNPGNNDDGTILETFANLNLDEDSKNYAPLRIGDRFTTIASDGKLTHNGDYPNQSKYIYLSNFTALEGIAPEAVPYGFGKLTTPSVSSVAMRMSSIDGTGGSDVIANRTTAAPTASFKRDQLNSRGDFDQNVYYGFNFSNEDSKQYLVKAPSAAGTGNNVDFNLEEMTGNDNASGLGSTYSDGTELVTLALSHFKQRKFVVPFQGGFDGFNPAAPKKTGTDIVPGNSQGFDMTLSTSSGSVAYKRAINAVSNPDEFDINMLVTPGIIHQHHSSVTNHAIDKVEDRADAFYIMDGSAYGRSIDNAVADIKTLDSNYVATYYPWVKILDSVKGKPTWVPPSVVLPGVYANNDAVAQEWFAPAGLNRGGLTEVLEAQTRLTHSERDDLYENRINPIATFPGQGVVVFGQKTLQAKPSALDRINVRRLLINLRKFIASSSRFLVFEQNTAALRSRFLNIVNPYLESVQSNSGLTAFRVVMDESNNTPDVVDRNQLVGQIFIQPTRTAEFIVLDFVIQPTGAAFPE